VDGTLDFGVKVVYTALRHLIKETVIMWTEFIWLMIDTRGEPLQKAGRLKCLEHLSNGHLLKKAE
jgi:hypothetical protein